MSETDPPTTNDQLDVNVRDRGIPPWPPPVQYAAAASSGASVLFLATGHYGPGLWFGALGVVLQIWALAYAWTGKGAADQNQTTARR